MNRHQQLGIRNKSGSGRIALWIVTGGLFAVIFAGFIVGIVFAVKSAVGESRKSAAFARITKSLEKLEKPMTSRLVSPTDKELGGLYGGAPPGTQITLESVPANPDKIAREIAEDVEHLPDYCRQLAAKGSDRSITRLATLSGLIAKFGGNVEPLLRMPEGSPAYDASIKVVHKRMSQKKLIESSCSDNDQVRKFSARVLGMSMPFGKLDSQGETDLAARTSTDQKQQTFDRLYAAAHEALESRLVGRYRLQIDAVWKTAEGVASPVGLTTVQPIVEVSCTGRTWTIKLGDQVWNGVIADLSKAKLGTRFTSIAAELSGLPGLRPDTELSISGGEQGLSVAIAPLPRYSPLQEVKIGASSRYEPAKDGYEKLSTILVR